VLSLVALAILFLGPTLVIWAIPDELSVIALGAVSAGYGWGILIVGSLLLLVSGAGGATAANTGALDVEDPPPLHIGNNAFGNGKTWWQRQLPSTRFLIIAGGGLIILLLVLVFVLVIANRGAQKP